MMGERSANHSPFCFKVLWGSILGLVLLSLCPSPSFAIPAFARKYDLSCTSCHTKPPRLNAFGEAFHMAGFQIPTVKEGEIKKKRKIGRIWSETDFLNVFSLRATGNLAESYQGGDKEETNLALPREIEIYLAGTVTDEISYFFVLAHQGGAIRGTGTGQFEDRSEFGLGKEFFLMFDLKPMMKGIIPGGESMAGMARGGMNGSMVMGPMIMVGKIDPSTNFSYPTNRQLILDLPGRVDSGAIRRFGLTPYAFSVKFFGIKTADGEAVEVTKEVLYNTTGDFGVDFHMMINNVMVQAGVMQGLLSGIGDTNQKKDPYLMVRLNFGQEGYLSGSLSALGYWGIDTAKVESTLVDWFRYGVAGNLKVRYFDLYGAIIWDMIHHLPAAIGRPFDRNAYGLTVEGDYLATDRLLLSVRYDQLDAGGFVDQRADGRVLTFQSRFYARDNFSLYLRDSVNIAKVGGNALQSFRNLIAAGVDFDF
jgi:hypothetical protein